jgi:hypothetical protein
VFNGQGEAQQLKLFPPHVEAPVDDAQVARLLVNGVRLERTRQFGACWLGWKLWKRLGLEGFFAQAVDNDPADVPWSTVAAMLAINRLCAPGSELAVEERWYPSTALERHLKQRYGELFPAEFDVLLYDLTSTYLQRLQKTIAAGRLKDRNKMERRLGKIQARHSQVNDLFEVTLRDTPEGVRLFWEIKKERKTWRDLREGAYMLRTNLTAGSRRGALVEVHAAYRGRSILSRAEKRAFHPALVSSKGTAGQGPCDGSVPGLRPLGNSETFTETAA